MYLRRNETPCHCCNQAQVLFLDTSKAILESKLLMRRKSLFKCWPPEKIGDSHPKVNLPISVKTEVFIMSFIMREKKNKEIKGRELRVHCGDSVKANTVCSDDWLKELECSKVRVYLPSRQLLEFLGKQAAYL